MAYLANLTRGWNQLIERINRLEETCISSLRHYWWPEVPPPRPRYQYSNLESGQIRLFRVVSTGSIIQCHIERVSLEQAPTYCALSYVWGDAEQDVEILLNDGLGERPFYVTPHLAAGIRQVNQFLKSTGKYQDAFIWIDAICINQYDLKEKETQIPIMGSIYANASVVCIWLGELSRDGLLSMTILQVLIDENEADPEESFSGQLERLEEDLIGLGIEKDEIMGFVSVMYVLLKYPYGSDVSLDSRFESFSSEHPELQLLKYDHPIWSALLTFFAHPWFSRIWTFQEIYFAREAYVLGGQLSFLWLPLSKVRSRLLSTRCILSIYSGESARKAGVGNVMGGALEMQASSKLDRYTWNLDRALLGLIRRHARLEKDYIYGFLGVVNEDIRRRIPIDYSTSTPTTTVFAQAVRLACEIAEEPISYWNELMSAYKGRKKNIEGLPSWCPDFSNPEMKDDVTTYETGPVISETVFETYKPYAWMEFPTGTEALIIPGFRLDHVEEVVPAPDILSFEEVLAIVHPDVEIDDPTFAKIFGAKQLEWLSKMESVFGVRATDNAITGGWPSRFVFDCLSDEHIDNLQTTGFRLLGSFTALMVASGITSSAAAYAKLNTSEAGFRSIMHYMMTILYWQSGKHHFRTSSGRLGFAPLPVSPGDCICFVPTGDLLHVLSHDCTKHVALAHVEGFMDDDLLEIVPTDKSQWQEFRLS